MTSAAQQDSRNRTATTSTPLHSTLANRWSPRSFDPTQTIDETALTAALEAARWTPSALNAQPWRFIVARRGSAAFEKASATLTGFNALWAGSASALIVAIAVLEDDEGKPIESPLYDLGQAVAHLTIQAHHDGLHVHQMAGFDVPALAKAFDLPARLLPVTVSAVGTLGPVDALPNEKLQAREVAPRLRLPLSEIVLINE